MHVEIFHKNEGENLFGEGEGNPDGCPEGHLKGFEPFELYYQDPADLYRATSLVGTLSEEKSTPRPVKGPAVQVYRHPDGTMAVVELYGDRYAVEC